MLLYSNSMSTLLCSNNNDSPEGAHDAGAETALLLQGGGRPLLGQSPTSYLVCVYIYIYIMYMYACVCVYIYIYIYIYS